MRSPVGFNDSRIFTRTAATAKAVNLGVVTFRGGIRF